MTVPTREKHDAERSAGTQGGPHLGALAVVSAALLVLGLAVSALIAKGTPFPSPFGEAAESLDHFRAHPWAARAGGLFQFASAVPLALYAATASARLHRLGVRAPGATIALAGGLLAAGGLLTSGLLQWSLSRPEVLGEPGVVRAVQYLAFLTGGPGHVVPLGLLLAGVAVPGLLAGLLPRPLAWTGLVIAALAELSTLTLLLDGAAVLLPIARFTGLAWLIAAGFLLPQRRPRRTGPASED
ncbi:hypothetical protein AB0J21_06645 [Streptomyces sp. NPDC049954]|uniref:hypothetical protein n=1 Tax=Streptomyces sp. NPDC049954 TaxID=3155779 RepID=UPI00343B8A8A